MNTISYIEIQKMINENNKKILAIYIYIYISFAVIYICFIYSKYNYLHLHITMSYQFLFFTNILFSNIQTQVYNLF